MVFLLPDEVMACFDSPPMHLQCRMSLTSGKIRGRGPPRAEGAGWLGLFSNNSSWIRANSAPMGQAASRETSHLLIPWNSTLVVWR